VDVSHPTTGTYPCTNAGFKAICVETRHAQRFLSTRPVKTNKNDTRGIAEMMRIGHYRLVLVASTGSVN
jgi:transposase